jgi:hypothetical protein
VLGLYLDPAESAVVLCVNKRQIRAPGRTHPVLSMGFGYIEGVMRDHRRHAVCRAGHS